MPVLRLLQDVADRKKLITDEDLLALITDEVHQAQVIYELIDLQVTLPTTPNSAMLKPAHADQAYSQLSCLCMDVHGWSIAVATAKR